MVKPIACMLMVVSLATFNGCSAADGSTSSGPMPTRGGPHEDDLQLAPDAPGHASKGPQPSEHATTDEPSDDQPKPMDSGRAHSVVVGAGMYAPRMINIQLGDSVEFNWQIGTHSVTSGFQCKADGMFASGVRPFPASYRVTFLRTGVFPFYSDPDCETMSGMITVIAPTS